MQNEPSIIVLQLTLTLALIIHETGKVEKMKKVKRSLNLITRAVNLEKLRSTLS